MTKIKKNVILFSLITTISTWNSQGESWDPGKEMSVVAQIEGIADATYRVEKTGKAVLIKSKIADTPKILSEDSKFKKADIVFVRLSKGFQNEYKNDKAGGFLLVTQIRDSFEKAGAVNIIFSIEMAQGLYFYRK